jgi:hypothetical protein
MCMVGLFGFLSCSPRQDYGHSNGGKPWKYVLIPYEVIV